MKRLQPWHLAVLMTALGLVGALCFQRFAPPRHNPWGPIDLTDRPGLGTWNHLTRLKNDTSLCYRELEAADVAYTPLPKAEEADRCGIVRGMRLERSLTPYSAELKMSCHQTAALYMWERHYARPAAESLLGAPIVRIETYGSFSCRNVAGTDRLSQHAFGNAIDISGFRLADGRRVDVKKHWGADGAEGDFLRFVHAGGCKLFSVTLGPDYNAAHADHFHFDMGRGDLCR